MTAATGSGAPGVGPVLADRVVEVLFNSGDATSPRWSAGSGLLMHGAVVLTAAHVVGPAGELLVRFRGVDERPARICALPGGGRALDDDLDLAILEILDHPANAAPLPAARLRTDPTLDLPNLEGCTAFGFPAFARKERVGRTRPVRETIRIDGYVPTGEGAVEGLATLRIRDAPHDRPAITGELDRSLWQGVSGAVVLAAGTVIGVVSEHHPPAGTNSLTVVPLTWIDRRPDAAAWWALLGVPNPAELPSLPEPALQVTDDGLEHRYRELLLHCPEFTRLPTPFDGLPPEYYLPRLLRAGDDVAPVADVVATTHRLVIVAPAGMGKTELLHDLVRTIAAEPGPLPVFVRLDALARRGTDHDVLHVALTELFTDLVDDAEIALLADALRRRRRHDPTAVLFLFDGLDEVPVARQDAVLARVRRTDRFVLTSRPLGRIDVMQDGATYAVDGLTDEAVTDFVHRWQARDPTAAGLLDRLTDDVRLGELARFPQLLLLLCWLWRSLSREAGRTRATIVAAAVDAAFDRATRMSDLPDGHEEVVPLHARRVLGQAALEAVSVGDGDHMSIARRRLLALTERSSGPALAGPLLALARRTGLVVPGSGGDDLQFLHQTFRAHLAAEALVSDDDPATVVDLLAVRRTGEEPLAAAAALDPTGMAALVLDRFAARGDDLFRQSSRISALCMEGLTDLRPLEERLRPVADAVLAGAAEWWSRARFTPAMGCLHTDHMRRRLRESLTADDGYLRWAAVEGLRALAEPTAVPLLVARLPDEPWFAVRTAVITALGRLRDPAAVDALWAHHDRLGAGAGSIEYRALGESLARLGAEPQLRTLLDDLDAVPAVGNGDEDDDVVEVLLGARPFVPPPLQNEITRALGRRVVLTAPHDIERYLAVVDDADATLDEHLEAITGLGEVGTPGAVDALMYLLVTTRSDELRDRAALALADLEGEISFVDVVQTVVDAFQSADVGDQRDGADLFLHLWISAARDKLTDLTFPEPDPDDDHAREPEPRLRTTAALLAALGGRAPAALLYDLTADDDTLVREAAVSAVGHLDPDDAPAPPLDLLAPLARDDPERRVRAAAVRALGTLDPPGAIWIVTPALDADHPAERAAAVAALAALTDRTALSFLVRRLHDEDDFDIRQSLIESAIDLSRPGPVPPAVADAILTDLDGDTRAREAGAHMAGRAGLGEAADRLRAMLESDPSENVREEAADTYGYLAGPDALLGLVDDLAAHGPEGERLGALAVALAHRPELTEQLAARIAAIGGHALATDRGVVVRYRSHTHVLELGGDERDTANLLDELEDADPARRWTALRELADRWDEPGVLGRVVLALRDPHVLVAAQAADVVDDVARDNEPDVVDSESRALIGHPDVLADLLGLLESSQLQIRVGWLLSHAELLPALLRAAVGGRHAARQVLWSLADRHGLRLFADGRALLATGREVTWDELPDALRPR